MSSHGIEFVDENDARRLLLGLVEHVADTGRADADKHLYKVRTRNREKRHFRLAGDRLSEECLAGSGRADHQDTFRDLSAKALELARVLKELDDFGNFGLGLVDARHVGKRYADLVLAQQSRLALAEGHRAAAAAAALHLPHEVNPDADKQKNRERADQQLSKEALLLLFRPCEIDVVLLEQTDERVVIGFGADREVRQRFCVGATPPNPVVLTNEVGIIAFRGLPQTDAIKTRHHRQQDDDDDNKYQCIFG